MHSLTEVGTNVPAFLAKLWKLVEDPETNDLICWNDDGTSFVIHNQAQFCRELLPLYYKHNNMASFVRQLNMYGFHKKVSVDAGGLKLDKDEMEFAHPCFMRGHAYLLDNIKRKIAESTRGVIKSPEVMNRVLGDVKQMKGRQESLDTKLSAMKRENEALWRELAVLRQKHHKQQQIVNKLIQFLLTVVQSPGNRLGIKRRYNQLMLHDKAHHPEGDAHHHHHHHHHKHRHQRQGQEGASSSVATPVATATSPMSDEETNKIDDLRNGPTIHELDPSTEFILPDGDGDQPESVSLGLVSTPSPHHIAASPIGAIDVDDASGSPVGPDLGLTMEQDTAAALLDEVTQSSTVMDKEQEDEQQPSSSDLAILVGGGSNGSGNNDDVSQSSISRDELDNHLDSMQSDLDGLKELLSKESCTLDANTLLSLFADDPISLGMGLPSQEDRDDDIIGSELIAYNPTLFDLTDDMDEAATDSTPLFADNAEKLLEVEPHGTSMESGSDLTTPNPNAECPTFPEPPKKKKK